MTTQSTDLSWRDGDMNGWEMLYEALRLYKFRPEQAICRDFILWMDGDPRIVAPQTDWQASLDLPSVQTSATVP